MTMTSPIFVVGPDRSGTSLLFSLLASHPNLSMVRRTNTWRYFYRRYGDLSCPENFEECLAAMITYRRMRHLRPDPDRIRREFNEGAPTYGRLFSLFHEHHAARAGKSRWGDKSLHTEHHADKILTEFPDARVIHMLRDPRDRCASMQKRYSRNEGRVAAATARWLASVGKAQQNAARYPSNYRIIRYETLAAQPEATLREICVFINEPYVPAMLTMEAVPELRDRGGNSSFGAYAPGVISTRSIGRYRSVLSQSEIAFIQILAASAMDRYEYPLEPIHFSPMARLRFYLIELPVNLMRLVGWRATEEIRIRRESIPAAKIMAPASGADAAGASL